MQSCTSGKPRYVLCELYGSVALHEKVLNYINYVCKFSYKLVAVVGWFNEWTVCNTVRRIFTLRAA
jgi:hypothetical protein